MSISFWCETSGEFKQELNYSNSNAASLMRLMGIDPEPAGEIEPDEIPRLKNHIETLLAEPKLREYEITEPRITVGNGISTHFGGRPDESIVRRLRQMSQLFELAQNLWTPVYWG